MQCVLLTPALHLSTMSHIAEAAFASCRSLWVSTSILASFAGDWWGGNTAQHCKFQDTLHSPFAASVQPSFVFYSLGLCEWHLQGQRQGFEVGKEVVPYR